jgi:hypothetical protein
MLEALQLGAMARWNKPKKSWRIFRRRSSADTFVGIVQAPDAEAAIKEAIKQFKITDAADQLRLIAHPRDL